MRYTVGSNVPGYLPDMQTFEHFESFNDARLYLFDSLERAYEDFCEMGETLICEIYEKTIEDLLYMYPDAPIELTVPGSNSLHDLGMVYWIRKV